MHTHNMYMFTQKLQGQEMKRVKKNLVQRGLVVRCVKTLCVGGGTTIKHCGTDTPFFLYFFCPNYVKSTGTSKLPLNQSPGRDTLRKKKRWHV